MALAAEEAAAAWPGLVLLHHHQTFHSASVGQRMSQERRPKQFKTHRILPLIEEAVTLTHYSKIYDAHSPNIQLYHTQHADIEVVKKGLGINILLKCPFNTPPTFLLKIGIQNSKSFHIQ